MIKPWMRYAVHVALVGEKRREVRGKENTRKTKI
jgi:hypothetical protein